jgi:hypothetical protein
LLEGKKRCMGNETELSVGFENFVTWGKCLVKHGASCSSKNKSAVGEREAEPGIVMSSGSG